MQQLIWCLLFLSVFAYTVNCDSALKFEPKTTCKWFDVTYSVNDTNIKHPFDQCKECKCCTTGKVKCKRKDCYPYTKQPPPCGREFRTVTDGDDGCCEKCNEACEHYKTEEDCPPSCTGPLYYPPGTSKESCCGVCGACNFRGHVVPEGNITEENIAHPCEGCVCSEGVVSCDSKATCPPERLDCVRPKINDDCEWYCPIGPTCYKGSVEIRAGEVRPFGSKYCFCMTHPFYWPLAVCGNKNHEGMYERMLHEQMCVKEPENPTLWNDEA